MQVFTKIPIVFNALLKKLGFVLFRYREDYHYCPDYYGHKYFKLLDIRTMPIFEELAKDVVRHGRSFLDYARLHMLFQAIWNVRKLGGCLCEIGVFRGGGSYFMASAARKLLEGRSFKIYSVDTFEGHPDDVDPHYDGQNVQGKFSGTSYSDVKQYLSAFPEVDVLKGRFQDRVDVLGDKKFSMVHLDVDIYSGTKDGLDFFHERLLKGGIILVDDYANTACQGVKQAVEEFIETHDGYCRFHLITGQCLLIRTA
jgi:hypothetical protein